MITRKRNVGNSFAGKAEKCRNRQGSTDFCLLGEKNYHHKGGEKEMMALQQRMLATLRTKDV